MSDRPRLEAMTRSESGTTAAARLRKTGRLPGVLFGHGIASQPVSLDGQELANLRRRASANALVELSVDGKPSVAVLIHGVQLDKITQRPLHVDLFAVRMTEELTAEVPLVGDGSAPATEAGGTLVHPVSSVKVRALPGDLPESIHYDLSSLTGFDGVITVADLIAPRGATIQTEPSEIVARVLPPRVEEAQAGAVEAAPAADAAAEGSSAEG